MVESALLIGNQKGQSPLQGSTLTIWRYVDGKAGHDNQSLGLVNALAELRPTETHTLRASITDRHYLLDWLNKKYDLGKGLPPPDLIVGAGHATHLPMLSGKHRHGGKTIVLMRPSLPLSWFDLCILPAHDYRNTPDKRVLITRGALNTIRPSSKHSPDKGLFLIGGPSHHYDWDEKKIIGQIGSILEARPSLEWTLSTSRRTPDGFSAALRAALGTRIDLVQHQQTSQEWLPHHMATAGQIWVTMDSVSMIYEALTSGAEVGLLRLPRKQPDRVVTSIENLINQGMFLPHRSGDTAPFNESARCARWINERWLTEN